MYARFFSNRTSAVVKFSTVVFMVSKFYGVS